MAKKLWKKLFWNRAEILEIVKQFLWNFGGINTNPERTGGKRGIKGTDCILADGGHYICHTDCYCDCPTFLLNPLTKSYF